MNNDYRNGYWVMFICWLIMTALCYSWKNIYYKAVDNQKLMIKIMSKQDSLIQDKQDSIKLLKHGQ